MSNFTAFLGGALRAVDEGISRNRQYQQEQERLEEERDFQREQARFKADLQRELQQQRNISALELEKIKATNLKTRNKASLLGGAILYSKGETRSERSINALSAFAQNRELVQEYLKDADKRSLLIGDVSKLIANIKNDKTFRSPQGPMSTQKPKIPVVYAKFANLLKLDSPLYNLFKKVEMGVLNEFVKADKNTLTTAVKNGDHVVNTAPPNKHKAVKLAANVYASTRPTSMTTVISPEKNIANLTSLIGSDWNPEQENNEGNNKYWSAANSPFVKLISGKAIPDDTMKEEARKWLFNREHGFVDEQGRIKKNDIIKLVRIYAKQNTTLPNSTPGYPPDPLTYEAYLKNNSTQRKKIEELNNQYQAAESANFTLTRLIGAVNETGEGSGIINNLIVMRGALPSFIKGAATQMFNIVTATGGGFFDHGSKLVSKVKNIKERYMKAEELAKKRVRTRSEQQEIAAARREALEMTLAYQLTAILQGGTGGRTISDQDVSRTLSIFGGDTINKEQKLAKLELVKDFIERALTRGQFFTPNALGPNANAGLFTSYLKVSDLLQNYKGGSDGVVDHFVKTVNRKFQDKFKNQPLNTVYGSTFNTYSRPFLLDRLTAATARGFNTINKSGDKYKYASGVIKYNNVALNAFIERDIKLEAGDSRTLGIIRDNDRLYVVNAPLIQEYVAARTDEERERIRKNIRGKFAFDLMSGETVPITYGFSSELVQGNKLPKISFGKKAGVSNEPAKVNTDAKKSNSITDGIRKLFTQSFDASQYEKDRDTAINTTN
tara:strand:+ start:3104 stop:5449 length:2346 start_codon:yes stop_codon:yes gene_type:complete